MGSSVIKFRCNWGTALCIDSSGYGWPTQLTFLKADHPHWYASSTANAFCDMLPKVMLMLGLGVFSGSRCCNYNALAFVAC